MVMRLTLNSAHNACSEASLSPVAKSRASLASRMDLIVKYFGTGVFIGAILTCPIVMSSGLIEQKEDDHRLHRQGTSEAHRRRSGGRRFRTSCSDGRRP